MAAEINLKVNERSVTLPERITLGELRDRTKPDADVMVLNGFPGRPADLLSDGDEVFFIRRGEIPKADELEAFMVARHTPRVHEIMKAATVGIAGLGGLGSNVAIALARMGIGRLILADFDVVEPTNLNRQQYAIEHLGMRKTEAMQKILAGINPYLEVVAHTVVLDPGNIPEIFREAAIVVECFDRADAKAMIMDTVQVQLPAAYVVGASGLAGIGAGNSIQSARLGDRVFMVGDLTLAAQPGRGLMAPRVGIAAHHQANVVAALLMDGEDAEL